MSVSANQKAEIKAVYNTAYIIQSNFKFLRGDDLTTTNTRELQDWNCIDLKQVMAEIISNVQKQFIMDYGWCKNVKTCSTIESRVLAIKDTSNKW